MIITISMQLEMYSSFYNDPNSCYIMHHIELHHGLLLRYHYDTYIILTFIHMEIIHLVSYDIGIYIIYIFDLFFLLFYNDVYDKILI